MNMGELDRVCKVLDELIKDLEVLYDIFGKDLYNLLSNDIYRDGLIKHYERKIRKVGGVEGKDVWDKIRDITKKMDKTEDWMNLRV